MCHVLIDSTGSNHQLRGTIKPISGKNYLLKYALIISATRGMFPSPVYMQATTSVASAMRCHGGFYTTGGSWAPALRNP